MVGPHQVQNSGRVPFDPAAAMPRYFQPLLRAGSDIMKRSPWFANSLLRQQCICAKSDKSECFNLTPSGHRPQFSIVRLQIGRGVALEA